MSAPQAPGGLGQQVNALAMQDYLVKLTDWVGQRREALAALDDQVKASQYAAELTKEMALNLQIWQTIKARTDRLLQIWDGGRVGPKELDQLSNAIWGRLDQEGELAGLSLPEACRMSDALYAQLCERLNLDASGAESVGRLRNLRATLERIRDQIALLSQAQKAEAMARYSSMMSRCDELQAKANRGGDIGGLIGPLENESAIFERDLIISVANQHAKAGDPQLLNQTYQLRNELLVRQEKLTKLVDEAVATLADPPKYAVPNVNALGEMPTDEAGCQAYLAKLRQVAKALDMVAQSYQAALDKAKLASDFAALKTAGQRLSAPGFEAFVAELAANYEQLPPQLAQQLLPALVGYSQWLQANGHKEGNNDEVHPA